MLYAMTYAEREMWHDSFKYLIASTVVVQKIIEDKKEKEQMKVREEITKALYRSKSQGDIQNKSKDVIVKGSNSYILK